MQCPEALQIMIHAEQQWFERVHFLRVFILRAEHMIIRLSKQT